MSRRPLVLGATLVALAATTAPAFAQLPTATTPAPAPSAGSASMAVSGGIATRRMRYFARHQRVLVTGTVKPFVAGQTVTLNVVRNGKVVARRRAAVTRGPRGNGRYSMRFTTPGAGFLRLVVKHSATAQQKAFRAKARRVQVVRWSAGAGSNGTKVLVLQRTLLSLGYAVPVTGHFDGGTARAVTAFRKTNGLGRTGFATTGVYDRALNHRGAFRLRYPRAGRHVEFDWSRQVLVLADKGRAWRTYHASSGKPSTPTVFGTFHFYRKQPGTNAHGMVHSNYFIGGYAIHGYASVPNYAASHGCIRVPIPNARDIYNHISLGETIFVYR
jgi:hypothetical protein